MNVSMWMSRDPTMVGLNTSVADAARLMAEKRVRRLLVVEPWPAGPRLLGIVSAKDVIHAFPPNVNPFAIAGPDRLVTPTTIGQIMTASPRSTTPDAPIEEAANLMCIHKIGALPVLRDKTLAGIITESDIFRAFVSLFGTHEQGARITFDVTQGEDVFELVGKLSKLFNLKISSLIWTRHDEIPVCVVRVTGKGVDKMLNELWRSGHAIVNVIRFSGPAITTPSVTPPQLQPFTPGKTSSAGLYPSA